MDASRETTAPRKPVADWEVQMMMIEDEKRQDDRREKMGWLACGVSISVTVLFALWVFSLTT